MNYLQKSGDSFFIFISCFLFVSLLLITGQTSAQNAEEVHICGKCHSELVINFQRNPHTLLDLNKYKRENDAETSCVACHGDPSMHLSEGGGRGNIFAFKMNAQENAIIQRCQTCHNKSRSRYMSGPHAKGEMDCVVCHEIHAGPIRPLLKQNDPQLCAGCHPEVISNFNLNEHHRLPEGILDCSTCHDPHEPQTRVRLGGFTHEQCFKCHADKQGPFVFEHASIRIEGCTICHDPHGSANRHMLHFQNVAELCYSCHIAVPGFHTRFTKMTSCTNCHSAIHGSNLSLFFLQ